MSLNETEKVNYWINCSLFISQISLLLITLGLDSVTLRALFVYCLLQSAVRLIIHFPATFSFSGGLCWCWPILPKSIMFLPYCFMVLSQFDGFRFTFQWLKCLSSFSHFSAVLPLHNCGLFMTFPHIVRYFTICWFSMPSQPPHLQMLDSFIFLLLLSSLLQPWASYLTHTVSVLLCSLLTSYK